MRAHVEGIRGGSIVAPLEEDQRLRLRRKLKAVERPLAAPQRSVPRVRGPRAGASRKPKLKMLSMKFSLRFGNLPVVLMPTKDQKSLLLRP